MKKTEKLTSILSGLVLVTGLSSCGSSSESAKTNLIAKKERLIDEIALGVETMAKELPDIGNQDRIEALKFTKIALSSICGALERKEITDIDLTEFLNGFFKEDRHQIFIDIEFVQIRHV